MLTENRIEWRRSLICSSQPHTVRADHANAEELNYDTKGLS